MASFAEILIFGPRMSHRVPSPLLRGYIAVDMKNVIAISSFFHFMDSIWNGRTNPVRRDEERKMVLLELTVPFGKVISVTYRTVRDK